MVKNNKNSQKVKKSKSTKKGVAKNNKNSQKVKKYQKGGGKKIIKIVKKSKSNKKGVVKK
jgi:hypothetical protein